MPASLTQWSAVETTTPGRAGAHTAPLPARPDTRSHPIHRAPLELDHLRGVPGPSQTVHRRRPRLGQERRGDVPRRDRSDLAGPRVAIAAHPPDRKAQGHSVPRSHRRNISAASGPACRWSTQARCLELLERVRAGEELVVTKRGTPVARVVPVDAARRGGQP